ncbi:hypothetical protein ACWFMI_23240 [Nocardiopsis terrae]
MAFGADGLLLGHTSQEADTDAWVRAEQLAPSCFALTSLAKNAAAWWPPRPGQDPPSPAQECDHLLIRHHTCRGEPWWLLVVAIPGWGGLATELPPAPNPPSLPQVLSALVACADQVQGVLVAARKAS